MKRAIAIALFVIAGCVTAPKKPDDPAKWECKPTGDACRSDAECCSLHCDGQVRTDTDQIPYCR